MGSRMQHGRRDKNDVFGEASIAWDKVRVSPVYSTTFDDDVYI